MATLTTANSAFTLSVRDLFPVPQSLQGYATDDSFATENVQPVQVFMGVDGQLSAGFVPYATVITFTFQADSPSIPFFDTVLEAQKANNEAFIFDGAGILQGTGEKYAMTKGFTTDVSPMSAGAKTLQPRAFQITFEKCQKAPN